MHFFLTQDLLQESIYILQDLCRPSAQDSSKPFCSFVLSRLLPTGLHSVCCLHEIQCCLCPGHNIFSECSLTYNIPLTGWLSFVVSFVLPESVQLGR